jgi:hypothetical protein
MLKWLGRMAVIKKRILEFWMDLIDLVGVTDVGFQGYHAGEVATAQAA